MRKWLATWAMLGMIAACNDALVIGQNRCTDLDAGACGTSPPVIGPMEVLVDFTDVSTVDPQDLKITWMQPNPCSSAPCSQDIELLHGGFDSVWTVPRASSVTSMHSLSLIDGNQNQTSVPFLTPPDSSGPLAAFTLSSDQEGTVTAHALWNSLTSKQAGPESVATVLVDAGLPGRPGPADETDRPIMRSTREAYPLGIVDVSYAYLLFPAGDAGASGGVSLIDKSSSALIEQSPPYPPFSQSVGGSAVATEGGIFVLTAGDGDPRLPLVGLLSVDAHLRYTDFQYVAGSNWRTARLVSVTPWTSAGYAVAAESDLSTGALSGSGNGNIDVVTFHVNQPVQGFRIRRSCIFKLSLRGFAYSNGALYVTTIGGNADAPRGLLCRMPMQPVAGGASAVPDCWQAPENFLLGDIEVSDSGSIFVVYGPYDANGDTSQQQIARVSLN